jgi:hypothetical protein
MGVIMTTTYRVTVPPTAEQGSYTTTARAVTAPRWPERRAACREEAMLRQVDWINTQRSRHAVRWLVAYLAALRERRAVRVTIN